VACVNDSGFNNQLAFVIVEIAENSEIGQLSIFAKIRNCKTGFCRMTDTHSEDSPEWRDETSIFTWPTLYEMKCSIN